MMRTGPRYIYFVQRIDTQAIKIGMSYHPINRFQELRREYAAELKFLGVLPKKASDYEMHWKFKDICVGGEWFEPTPRLLSYINESATLDLPDLDMNEYQRILATPIRPPRCAYCGRNKHAPTIAGRHPITGKTGLFHQFCYRSLIVRVDAGFITE